MMKFLFTSSLLAFLLIIGCHSGRKVILESENVVYCHLNKDASIGIMVISDTRKGQTWYKTQKSRRIETIKNIPQTSLHNVWQAGISPNDKYLAVLSEGEGHPIIEIFEMEKIFAQREGWDDEMVAPFLTVDPYPGSIWMKGWQSNKILVLQSNVPLNLIDKKERRVPIQDPDLESQEFLWDVSVDIINMK